MFAITFTQINVYMKNYFAVSNVCVCIRYIYICVHI